jgi:polyhydroxybutyrate depolymerase
VTVVIICAILIVTILLPATAEKTSSNKILNKLNKFGQPKDLISRTTKLRFMIAGKALRCIRSYWLHVPPNYDGSEPVPLVLVLHGSGKIYFPYWFHFLRGSWIEEYSNFSKKADEEGFIVAYPNSKFLFCSGNFGYDHEISDNFCYKLIDDIGFIEDLIGKMERTYNINSSRIYVTGLSGGAIMSYSIGSHLPEKVAAIAPVAGTIGGNPSGGTFNYIKPPDKPVPAIIFHGTNDTNLPYDGSPYSVSVNESVSFWVNHTGCDPDPEINISESGKIIKRTYTNNSNNMEVILYTTVGGGHWWPGSDKNFGIDFFTDTIQEIDATDLIWEFFQRHPKE